MTIDLAPLLRSRRGTAKRPLQPPGAKASLPRPAVVVFVVQKHKLAAYRHTRLSEKNKSIGVQVIFC